MRTVEWLSRTDSTYLRYLFFGGLNVSISFIIYCCGIELGFKYYFANSVAWIVGLIVSFIFNTSYVFKSDYHYKKFILLFVSNIFGLIISMMMLRFFIKSCHINPILSSIITIPCVVTVNFLAAKLIIFKPNMKSVTQC